MAPQNKISFDLNFDKNNNQLDVNKKQPQVEESNGTTESVNGRLRKAVKNCLNGLTTNLNVLVIGGSQSGKTSLINSMNMALNQKWSDCAKYNPGRKHIIQECVLHTNKPDKQSQKQNHKTKSSKVSFWDTRGFDGIYDNEHTSLILRYVLEGRIPPKCIPCVLLMSKEMIKKRYRGQSCPHRRIDLVLFVSDATAPPHLRLINMLINSMQSSKIQVIKNVPIISVVTKADDKQAEGGSLNEYNLEMSRLRATDKHHSDWIGLNQPTRVDNYRHDFYSWDDKPMKATSVVASPANDRVFLNIWREIVTYTWACGGQTPKRIAMVSENEKLKGQSKRLFSVQNLSQWFNSAKDKPQRSNSF